MEAPGVPAESGRSDALLRHMLPYLIPDLVKWVILNNTLTPPREVRKGWKVFGRR